MNSIGLLFLCSETQKGLTATTIDCINPVISTAEHLDKIQTALSEYEVRRLAAGGAFAFQSEFRHRGIKFGSLLSAPDNRGRALFAAAGGPGGDRTHDLRVANAALSQLSYKPKSICCSRKNI